MKIPLFCLMLATVSGHALAFGHTSSANDESPEVFNKARRQAQEVLDEKSSRTAAQKKIDSQLLNALKQKRGETRGVPTERIKLDLDQKGRALVDITGSVSPQLTSQIRKLGGIVISQEAAYHTMRARLALEKMEALAARKDVSFIAPAAQPMFNRVRPD